MNLKSKTKHRPDRIHLLTQCPIPVCLKVMGSQRISYITLVNFHEKLPRCLVNQLHSWKFGSGITKLLRCDVNLLFRLDMLIPLRCSPSFSSVCPIATRYPKMHWYVQKPLRDLRASAHVWTILNPRRVWHGLTKCWAVLTFLKVVATEIMAIVMGKAFSNFSGPLRHYIFVGKTGEHRSRFWPHLFPS
jgi:hypothetical protein